MLTLYSLVAVILILATTLPLFRSRQWWVRALDFPRLQIAIFTLTWILVFFLSGLADNQLNYILPALLLACLTYQLWWIWPSTPLHAKEVLAMDRAKADSLTEFKILTSNVLMSNRDSGRLLALVNQHKPDVFAALETDDWWQAQLDTLSDYPHRIACPLDNRYGMHVYSRHPLVDAHTDFLVEDDVPSMCAHVRLSDQTAIRIHIIHPSPPAPGENPRSTERDVELLILAKTLQNHDEPVIVTGDLNDVAWSETTRLFRRISGLLDPRTGRGMFNTFHADHWFARWPLDHVFTSNHFRVVDIQRLGHVGSDHFPMLVELALDKPLALDSHPTEKDADKQLVEDTLDTQPAAQANTPSINQDCQQPGQ